MSTYLYLQYSPAMLQGNLGVIVKKLLSGVIPVCVNCKKIRDNSGYWNQIESYIEDHSEAKSSHAVCRNFVEVPGEPVRL